MPRDPKRFERALWRPCAAITARAEAGSDLSNVLEVRCLVRLGGQLEGLRDSFNPLIFAWKERAW